MKEKDAFPSHIFHFWGSELYPESSYTYETLLQEQDSGLFNVLNIAQGIRQTNSQNKVVLSLITVAQFHVYGLEIGAQPHSALQAANIVIPQEFHEILSKHIDFGSKDELCISGYILINEAI